MRDTHLQSHHTPLPSTLNIYIHITHILSCIVDIQQRKSLAHGLKLSLVIHTIDGCAATAAEEIERRGGSKRQGL